jgi:hypothetical protein
MTTNSTAYPTTTSIYSNRIVIEGINSFISISYITITVALMLGMLIFLAEIHIIAASTN